MPRKTGAAGSSSIFAIRRTPRSMLAEKALKDAEGRLPADVKGDIDGAVSALRAVMQRDQAQPIRDGIERLRRASMRIGEAPNRAGQGSGGQRSAAGDNPDVIDAEFREVDDGKRKAG